MKMKLQNFGIGVDIEEIERFRNKKFQNPLFLNKIFTDLEIQYSFSKKNTEQHLAARFAGKEAVIKSLYNIGMSNPIKFNEIEIKNNKDGVPEVFLKSNNFEGFFVHLSLSHCEGKAIAFVITTVNSKDCDEKD